jgi:S-adenosylmethionine decarboxylase
MHEPAAAVTPRAAALATHLLAECYGCAPALLDDPATVERLVRDAAAAANAQVISVALHRFSPQGVSGVAILAESHLAVHTWPEHGFASIELYVCGGAAQPERGHALLVERLAPRHVVLRTLARGDLSLVARYPAPAS